MSDKLADFYIIGAMKCATSTLHEQLARRRAFFMTDPKEPNFFNDDELYPSKFDWYKGLFAGAHAGQICGESSTHYTKLPTYQHTAERIHQHTPGARLVYVMRDPIERLVSHYIHEWTEGRAHTDISKAILADEQYVAYSCYARQLQPYLDLFDKAQILPVFFEHLTARRTTELQRIAQFLGDTDGEPYHWHEEVQQTNVSKDRMRKSAVREAFLSMKWGRKLKDMLPAQVKDKVKSVWQMRERPTLDAKAQQHVDQVIGRDLGALSALLGMELNLTNFKARAKASQPVFV